MQLVISSNPATTTNLQQFDKAELKEWIKTLVSWNRPKDGKMEASFTKFLLGNHPLSLPLVTQLFRKILGVPCGPPKMRPYKFSYGQTRIEVVSLLAAAPRTTTERGESVQQYLSRRAKLLRTYAIIGAKLSLFMTCTPSKDITTRSLSGLKDFQDMCRVETLGCGISPQDPVAFQEQLYHKGLFASERSYVGNRPTRRDILLCPLSS
jgi:hypothetical protein